MIVTYHRLYQITCVHIFIFITMSSIMPLIFISLHNDFVDKIKEYGFEAHCMEIQKYEQKRHTFYISASNSLCKMTGGYDGSLTHYIFPHIEDDIKNILIKYGKFNDDIKYYLPVGSSLIYNYDNTKSLVITPTMKFPTDVSNTNNAYYATTAALKNISMIADLNKVDVVITGMCCGVGGMKTDKSIKQIVNAYETYNTYKYDNIINDEYNNHKIQLLIAQEV